MLCTRNCVKHFTQLPTPATSTANTTHNSGLESFFRDDVLANRRAFVQANPPHRLMGTESFQLRGRGACTAQLLLLVLLAFGALARAVFQLPAAAKVVCRLHMEGFGDKTGLAAAELVCSGGLIRAAAHPMLAPFTRSFTGVQWAGSTGGCGVVKKSCLLTICGNSVATFDRATVSHVNVSNAAQSILCLAGHSSLVLRQARFHGNTGNCIKVFQPWANATVTLGLSSCVFTNNSATVDAGGALALAGGTAWVESSTFLGNSALQQGGAIMLTRTAKLSLVSCLLQANTGDWCGGGSALHLMRRQQATY